MGTPTLIPRTRAQIQTTRCGLCKVQQMHPSKPGQAINDSKGQASLLTPSSNKPVVYSPMQKGANQINSDDDLPEDNAINFIKPQNEIFKKLDGKIQKIVAAHSSMNKMYSLNDFSGVGPKKPIELPPQLPRPPPWVPKVSSDYNCSQWAEDSINSRPPLSVDLSESSSRQGSSLASLNRVAKLNPGQIDLKPQLIKAPMLTIDSAISKLHQRRQQIQQHPLQISSQQMRHSAPIPQPPRLSTQARLLQQAHELQQQLKAAAASQNKNHHVEASLTTSSMPRGPINADLPSTSRNVPTAQIDLAKKSIPLGALLQMQKRAIEQQTGVTICPKLSPEEKRRFQNELINIFRQEIAAVTKLAKLKFNPQTDERPKTSDSKSLLIKKSPQSLFNTIRRETSLLLRRGDLQQNRPSPTGVSLLTNNRRQPIAAHTLLNRRFASQTEPLQTIPRSQVHRYHTIKVAVPPSEFHKHTCTKHTSGKDNAECNCYESKADLLDIDQWLPARKFTLKYSTLQMKLSRLKFFPRRDEYNRKRGYCVSMTPADARRRKSPQKSLDKIVDRLQARCLSSTSCSPIQGSKSLLQSVSSSPIPSQASRETTPSPPSSPKPIPVFRTTGPSAKGGSNYLGNTGASTSSRPLSQKAKKAKRLHHIGLKLSNYLDREKPTPTTEKLTVEQFAKCLNLVRTNDASLKRHQEKLLQSEMKWRLPVGDRPLRLRRIRGERIHMPASASYRATRKAGLQ